jgi:hypothetical protein
MIVTTAMKATPTRMRITWAIGLNEGEDDQGHHDDENRSN